MTDSYVRAACLALDLATSTGWAVISTTGKILRSGTLVLAGEDREKFAQLYKWLWAQPVTPIAIERPWVRGKNTPFLMGLRGVAMAIAGGTNSDFFEYANSTVKKALTGAGNAEKETMMRMVEAQTGIRPETDDEADAIAVGLCWYRREGLGWFRREGER